MIGGAWFANKLIQWENTVATCLEQAVADKIQRNQASPARAYPARADVELSSSPLAIVWTDLVCMGEKDVTGESDEGGEEGSHGNTAHRVLAGCARRQVP